MTLTREQILTASDRKYETVDIPEWGGSVRVRSLTVREQARLADIVEKTGDKNLEERVREQQLRTIVFAVVDESGNPLFREEDVEALLDKNPQVILRLQAAILRVSGLEQAAARALEKN